MNRNQIFAFLEVLQQNNSKEWMDANRKWYEDTKSLVVDVMTPILEEVKSLDPRIVTPSPRRAISRINNNLMFHPERPTYKDHFGIVFSYGKGLADFYIHLGVDETLVAGGLWHPPADKLKKLRSEIDYEGHRLVEVVDAPFFKKHFELFNDDRLKNAPKGYDKDHEHIGLLKMKSLGAWRQFDKKDFLTGDFKALVIESFEVLQPMIDFINVAISDE